MRAELRRRSFWQEWGLAVCAVEEALPTVVAEDNDG